MFLQRLRKVPETEGSRINSPVLEKEDVLNVVVSVCCE
jgi:hypothetical protein